MATLTVQNIARTGLNPLLAAAAAGGDQFANPSDQRTFLWVDNADASAKQVTIAAQDTSVNVPGYGTLTVSDIVVSVPAGEARLIGPIPQAYNNASGMVSVAYDDDTSVTVGAIYLPK